jgi:hypothetical protein|tara:strand:- start:1725 stop:1952 length:228 start_codon:yes stop_codon:yes gene_type:complete
MKKILIIILLLAGCKNMDENGRLEKVRFSVPAFFHVEMEYYSDQENLTSGSQRRQLPSHKIINGKKFPRLMEMGE